MENRRSVCGSLILFTRIDASGYQFAGVIAYRYMNKFSAIEAFTFGWETFKKRAGFFIGVTVAVCVASAIVSSITNNHGFILEIVGFCVSSLIGMGMAALFLKAHEDVTKPEFADLWHPQDFLSYLGASILTGIAVIVGTILLIVPGIFAAIVLGFGSLIVIDRHMSPIDSLKESMRITKGKRWEVLVLFLLAIVLNIVGALALLVGLLITIPMTMLAFVHAYRTLEHGASEVEVAPVNTPAATA